MIMIRRRDNEIDKTHLCCKCADGAVFLIRSDDDEMLVFAEH